MGGGLDTFGEAVNTFCKYDSSQNQWQNLASLNLPVFNNALVVFHNNFIFSIATHHIERYDIINNQWQNIQLANSQTLNSLSGIIYIYITNHIYILQIIYIYYKSYLYIYIIHSKEPFKSIKLKLCSWEA